MAQTTVSDAISFPEDTGTGLASKTDADWNSAGHFGGLARVSNQADYVENGLGFTLNATTPSLDIAAGTVRWMRTASVNVQDSNGDYNNTWDDGYVVAADIPAESGISLTDSATNHVYVAFDPTNNNSVYYEVNTTDSAPSDPSIKIGTVDTTNDTTTELNRDPDATFRKATIDPTNLGGQNIVVIGSSDNNDELRVSDESNGNWMFKTWNDSTSSELECLEFKATSSGVDARGAINFANSDNIQDAGTDAIQFDGSQNVTIPNGLLTTGEVHWDNGTGEQGRIGGSGNNDYWFWLREDLSFGSRMGFGSSEGIRFESTNYGMAFYTDAGSNWGTGTERLAIDSNGANVPNGTLDVGGNPVPSSSTGTEYDIQKDGTDGTGVINFKTS